MHFSKWSSRLKITPDLPLMSGKILIDVSICIFSNLCAHSWKVYPQESCMFQVEGFFDTNHVSSLFSRFFTASSMVAMISLYNSS